MTFSYGVQLTLMKSDPVLAGMGVEDTFDYAGEGGEFMDRLSRCYELAAKAFYLRDIEERWDRDAHLPDPRLLVHGSWHGPGATERIDHAWVELSDGRVWEPITAGIYTRSTFYNYTRAQSRIVYTEDRAKRLMLQHEHFGPWSV